MTCSEGGEKEKRVSSLVVPERRGTRAMETPPDDPLTTVTDVMGFLAFLGFAVVF